MAAAEVWEYYVGKERLQVDLGFDEDGERQVEYRLPGDRIPEAAAWGHSLDRYLALGLIVRVPRAAIADAGEASDDELVAIAEADGSGDDPSDPDPAAPSEFPKVLGGGMYELSDGSKVRGKAKAEAAQAAIAEA